MSAFRIRPAEPRDAAALAALGRRTFLATFVEEFGLVYPPADLDPYLEAKFSEAAAAAEIGDPRLQVWVAQDEESALVGYALIGPASLPHPELSPEHGELHRLYLDRRAHGSGLAAELMETALERLGQTPGPTWLGVWSGNLRAQRFYARYGFKKAGEYDYRVGASRDHEFIFRKG